MVPATAAAMHARGIPLLGRSRPILHTGQLPAADPTLDGNVLGGESMAARSKTFALPWFARSDYPALLDLFSDSKPCAR